MSTSTITPVSVETPACVGQADLFLNPLLELSSMAANAAERRQQAGLARQAEELCLECPLMMRCLYTAVVEHDVAGYVAGTTQRQRNEMRNRLKIRVAPEDFDSYVGVNSGRQVDHDEVLRLRAANPTASLESLANRLGCSLSTVKRHLRKAREGGRPERSARRLTAVPPTIEQVMMAYRDVTPPRPTRRSAAA